MNNAEIARRILALAKEASAALSLVTDGLEPTVASLNEIAKLAERLSNRENRPVRVEFVTPDGVVHSVRVLSSDFVEHQTSSFDPDLPLAVSVDPRPKQAHVVLGLYVIGEPKVFEAGGSLELFYNNILVKKLPIDICRVEDRRDVERNVDPLILGVGDRLAIRWPNKKAAGMSLKIGWEYLVAGEE